MCPLPVILLSHKIALAFNKGGELIPTPDVIDQIALLLAVQ